MQLKTYRGPLNGSLRVPSDKSISHRSIMLAALSKGTSQISHLLLSDDVKRTIAAFQALGVQITQKGDLTIVTSPGHANFKAPNQVLDMGNSGTTIRLMMGILATCDFEVRLVGDSSLSKRPMARVLDPLIAMGVEVTYLEQKGYLPLVIKGCPDLAPIDYQMPVASAQVKSALIFAGLFADGTSRIIEKTPTRNHTEQMLPLFGGHLALDGTEIQLKGPQCLEAHDVQVPGDISSAAFFLVAALILPNSSLELQQVGVNPTRTGILDVIKAMGGHYELKHFDTLAQVADIEINYQTLQGTVIAGELIPRLIDELPIIALLATQAQGVTIIKDAQELKVKESDRIAATVELLQKFGANIEATEDGMIIKGPTPLTGNVSVSSHGDHRLAMVAIIASLLVQTGQVTLEGVEAVSVSYPGFFEDLERLSGGHI